MDLRRSELDGLKGLAAIWKTTPGAEFEALLTGLDLTAWQDVVQYLRSLGMKENPQIVRMNICLANDIRFTLEGAGVIQAYCRDNRIADKPFTAMMKENIAGAAPVELNMYGARAKLKREIPLAADDARVKDAIQRWDQLGKYFRNIQRFEFVAPGGLGIRFDISLVRENSGGRARTFQEARITSEQAKYEAEVELTASRESTTPDAAANLIIRGLSWLLQGKQRSYVLVSNAGANAVRTGLQRIFGTGPGGNVNANGNRNSGRDRRLRYPGPQPATLERVNMDTVPEPGVPNIRMTSYNVTDKADGLRCMLYVSENGRIFLVDGGMRVYATGKQTDASAAGIVLDGEWIQRNKKGEPVSHFYAFDILATKGGDTGVTKLPFMIHGAMLGSTASVNTRQAAMAQTVGALNSATQTVRGIPSGFNIQIGMKTFRSAAGGGSVDIFRDAAAAVLEDAKSAPYTTDGLIFTPNASPLPLGKGSWPEQLKWKPSEWNTIDFLVLVDKERTADGKITDVDAISTKYREDTGKTVRYKTLRLFVGGKRDAAFSDPRRTVLSGEPLPVSLEEGEYREIEFRPTAPRDPMAAICYVPISEGAEDPAGATPAANMLDIESDIIRTVESRDIIQSDMIVEMSYHPERAPGFRWVPIRVRHDKTERWATGQKGGTMNADWVANSIWSSIHNPVTSDMIRTGQIVECVAPAALAAPSTYYTHRAPRRDLMKVQCLRNFHNDFIKREILLRKTLQAGASICDLAMGRGGDLHKWVAQDPSYVLGCDFAANNINNPEDGAYRRLLDKMIDMGGRDRVPPMIFVQADMARRLKNGEAGITAEDQGILRTEFNEGRAASGFDVVSCMFALHYMFRDENTLAGFLTNLADTVKVGGYFIGCGPDGDAMARLLHQEQTVIGRDGKTDVWSMTKRYGSAIGSSVPPSNMGLGLAVDVDFISIGETHTEYLVSWAYLQKRLAEAGLELLTATELTELGLPASSQMFGETWEVAAAAGKRYEMTEAVRRFSFLNRWYIFRRRSDLRPAPPVMNPIVYTPGELTQVVSERAPIIPRETIEVAGQTIPLPRITEVATESVTETGVPTMDIIELPETTAAQAPPFLVNAATVDPDPRLGEDYSDWPRYMSLGTLVDTYISDMNDPAIKYPSVEAAIASAKYQLATKKPELGPKIFSVNEVVHQKFQREREKLVETGAPPEALRKSVDDQVAQTRILSSKNKMNAYKAEWNPDAWDAQKEMVYRNYLTERYLVDDRFQTMVNAIRARGGEILFVNGTEYNQLGVGVRVDGSIVGGDNLIGKIMMSLGA
jgi:hypothetical protein